jgi:hypothetical protein
MAPADRRPVHRDDIYDTRAVSGYLVRSRCPGRTAHGQRGLRDLRAAGPLAEAVRLVGQLGPYGVADGPDANASLGAAVLEANWQFRAFWRPSGHRRLPPDRAAILADIGNIGSGDA